MKRDIYRFLGLLAIASAIAALCAVNTRLAHAGYYVCCPPMLRVYWQELDGNGLPIATHVQSGYRVTPNISNARSGDFTDEIDIWDDGSRLLATVPLSRVIRIVPVQP